MKIESLKRVSEKSMHGTQSPDQEKITKSMDFEDLPSIHVQKQKSNSNSLSQDKQREFFKDRDSLSVTINSPLGSPSDKSIKEAKNEVYKGMINT